MQKKKKRGTPFFGLHASRKVVSHRLCPQVPLLVRAYSAPQSFVQPSVQPFVQPGVSPLVQPGVQPFVQPGVQLFVQPGVPPFVQPFVQLYATNSASPISKIDDLCDRALWSICPCTQTGKFKDNRRCSSGAPHPRISSTIWATNR
jgi:hypothetical protein